MVTTKYKYKVHGFRFCPYVQRVLTLLNALELDYKVEWLERNNLSSEFLASSPLRKVPALLTPEGSLFESFPVMEYLCETYTVKGLLDRDAYRRALERAAVEVTSNCYLELSAWRKEPTGSDVSVHVAKVTEWLLWLNQQINNSANREFPVPSLLVISIYPALERLSLLCDDDLKRRHPKFMDWKQELETQYPVLQKSCFTGIEDYYSPK